MQYPSREGNGTPLQYSCLENPMDGGAWWAAVHGVAKSQTRLSNFTLTFHFHALEKEMATHYSVLAWRIPGTGEAWWAAIYGVTQSRTRLKRLSSSSSILPHTTYVLQEEKGTFTEENSTAHYINQVIKFNITSNRTTWHLYLLRWCMQKDIIALTCYSCPPNL